MWKLQQRSADQNAHLAEIYRRYLSMVQRRAMRILGSRAVAEDVAHEVFMRFIRYYDAQEVTFCGTLLYRMTTQVAIGRLRSLHRPGTTAVDVDPADPSQDPVDDRLALKKVLSLVNDQQAQIAAYYYVDGMNQDEIAELLNMPRRQVGRQLERFCERARRLLGQPDAAGPDLEESHEISLPHDAAPLAAFGKARVV